MKRLLIVPLLSLSLWGSSLSTLIEKAQENELVEVYKERLTSSQKSYDAVKSSYFPRIDMGASGQLISPKDSLGAGQIYNAHAEASLVILDGFKRENILDEKTELRHSSEYDLSQIKKDVSLQVSTLYFNLQIVQADIDALDQTREQLVEQLKRQKKFFAAKLTTEDNVVRIEAAVANLDYRVEVKRYEYDETMAKLYTLTNEVVEKVDASGIVEPTFEKPQELDQLKSMASQAEAVRYRAEQVDSSYYPNIILTDRFGYTHYEDDSLAELGLPGVERVNTQNVLMLNFKMNIIDFSAASEQRQVVLAEHNALKAQLAYKRKETNADLKLAERAIDRSKKLLEASELSQKASNRTFEIIDKKYKARVVDYVKYLDALTQKTEAQAQYNRATGALEISYARYYYYAGFDVKEYVK
ncbi:MAG: TolC family protein [Sulfurimonadaceae bacterium]